MAKKKKKSIRNDGRGYSTGNIITTKSNKNVPLELVGKSKQSVDISRKAYNELMNLIDEVKQSLGLYHRSGIQDEAKVNHDQAEVGQSLRSERVIDDVSINNKRLVKRITFLNDNLQQLKFSDEQIKQALVALIMGEGLMMLESSNTSIGKNYHTRMNSTYSDSEILSLDAALDWLCLNLPSEKLPPLFTDPNQQDSSSDLNLRVIKAAEEFERKEMKTTIENNLECDKNDTLVNETQNCDNYNISENFVNKKNDSWTNKIMGDVEKTKQKESEIKQQAEKRAWLLSQYQYEEDEDEMDEGAETQNHDTDKDSQAVTNHNLDENQKQNEREKLPEEIRLEKLEEELNECRLSVNDEANNYMRTKYEIKEMKNKLKELDRKVRSLRGKVGKKLALLDRDQEEKQINNVGGGDDDDDNNNDEYGAFDLFDSKQEHNNQNTENVTTKVIQYINAEIPNGWSGKTPKLMLIEHCRKQKWAKPSFTSMENTTNGCLVKVKSPKDMIIIFEEGPFKCLTDAEHYVATKALYSLNPKLPMYLLMPPDFRDLWMSWLKEKEIEERDALTDVENKEREKVASLVSYLSEVTRKKVEIKYPENADVKETLDNWDDQSLYSDTSAQSKHENSPEKIDKSRHLGEWLRSDFISKQKGKKYLDMYQNRVLLPIFDYRQEIIDTVRKHSVTVLCAETGAGKTTQCPQYILEDALLSGLGPSTNILCTQPRRISALSVAERVADEIDEPIGQLIGYQIRMEAKKSRNTKLMFCTTGIILRRLQDDPELDGVSHVIVDEVHERQWEIDFLLISLRRLLTTTRADLKVILMSATLDSKLFCSFFHDAPLLSVPGRTFPVSEYFLEDLLDATDHLIEEGSKYAIRDYHDTNTTTLITGRGEDKRKEIVNLSDLELDSMPDHYEGYKLSTRRSMQRVDETIVNYDLIEDVLILIADSENQNIIVPPLTEAGSSHSYNRNGSILIFLPGFGEIRTLHDRLKGSRIFGDSNRFDVIPMHSTLSQKDQKRAFLKPKHGCRKIILATNIAETSITIDDCVCVIDSGLVREVVRDKRSSYSKLITTWCSQASCKQRGGRAGRVQPGICCKLYSAFTSSSVMKKQSIPELQRMPLEEVCLMILAGNLATDCMSFLMQAPQPPTSDAVNVALKVLEDVNAIEPISSKNDSRVEIITPLGKHLAKLPVDIRLGKMLIFGVLFKALDKTLTIAASLSAKSPFSTNIDGSQEVSAAHKAFTHASSDFITVCNVWDGYCSARSISISNGRKFCEKHYLNRVALEEINDTRKQYIQLLVQIGFIDSALLPSNDKVLSTCYNINGSNESILSAIICAGFYPNCAHALTKYDEPLSMWQQNDQLWFHKSSTFHNKKKADSEWFIFHEKFATHKVFISTATTIKPFSLLLFGKSIEINHLSRRVVVDGWIELGIPAQTAVIFRELRREMSKELNKKISFVDTEDDTNRISIIDGISKLISLE